MEEDYTLDLELEGGRLISISLKDDYDLCEELVVQNGISRSEQHRRLCASASAMRTHIKEHHEILTPLSYLRAAIYAILYAGNFGSYISSTSPIVSEDISTIISLMSILVPLVSSKPLDPSESLGSEAGDGVTALLPMLKNPRSPATTRSVIKLIGVLLEEYDFGEEDYTKDILKMIFEFSIDKHREELRLSAQVWVEKIYKSIQGTNVVNKVSELFYNLLFDKYLGDAIAVAWHKTELTEYMLMEQTENKFMLMESVHMVTVLKLIVLYLSNNVVSKVMSEIYNILGLKFSLLTRTNFALLKAILDSPRADELNGPNLEMVIYALVNYVSDKDKDNNHNNPVDTILCASVLLKMCIHKLYVGNRIIWLKYFTSVFEALAGVATAEISVSEEIAGILRELKNQQIDYDL